MLDINPERRTIGVNFYDGRAEVTVWAPEKKKLEILINNELKIPLTGDEFGYWNTSTDLLKPGDLYQFILDDEHKLPDPASLAQPGGVHKASQAVDVSSYTWQDDNWRNPALQDYIVYELHAGTFTEEGTFKAIEQKLDHLAELGVTAIELMPVAQFPGSRNWGYDGVFPFAVQHSYGGAEGLQQLVDTCHQKGLAVILDVVYNHLGPEGNYLGAYGPYFTDKYNTPWGKAVNFDDAWCDGVRHFFLENALMWFRDFHIDALRMDAVHAIKDLSPVHLLRELREHVDALMQRTGRQHYLIVECDLNDTRFINPKEAGGYGMDAQWMDEFHHSLRVSAGEVRSGYYADFEGIAHLAKAYKDAYVYDGQYSPHRHRRFGVKTDNPGHQFLVCSQNHDQVGNRMLGERSSQLVSYEMLKLLAGAVMVSPFLPMLFMGEEYAESNPFLYFVSHTDAELVEAVRKGRKAEFAAFHALGEAPDPQATSSFQRSKLQWELTAKEGHRQMLEYYKALIRIRKQHPALHRLNRKHVDVQLDEQRKVIALHRWHDAQHVLCFMNFSGTGQAVLVPPMDRQWQKILDSGEQQWLGKGEAAVTLEDRQEVILQPESIVIYSNH